MESPLSGQTILRLASDHATSPSPRTPMTIKFSIISLSLTFVSLGLILKLTGFVLLKDRLCRFLPNKEYSYIGADFPPNLALPLQNVLLQFDNPKRAFRLDTESGIREWSTQVPSTDHAPNGVIHLGEGKQPFTVGMIHQLRCLDLLREEVIRNRPIGDSKTRSQARLAPVTRHCLNYFRQMVMCRGDWEMESFQFASHKNPIDWRGVYQCKDWETLWKFVRRNQEKYEDWLQTQNDEL